jgi:hypothetical protein
MYLYQYLWTCSCSKWYTEVNNKKPPSPGGYPRTTVFKFGSCWTTLRPCTATRNLKRDRESSFTNSLLLTFEGRGVQNGVAVKSKRKRKGTKLFIFRTCSETVDSSSKSRTCTHENYLLYRKSVIKRLIFWKRSRQNLPQRHSNVSAYVTFCST